MSLRTYPPRFGKHVRRLYPRFIKEREVQWDLSEQVLNQDIESFFGSLEWGDLWHDAEMTNVLAYLRGSRHLHLGHWRPYFPDEL